MWHLQVSVSHIPHASKQLHETAVPERRADNQAGPRDAARAQVDEREHERGESESAEAERRRVGELAALRRLVRTGLEFTSESGQTDRVAGIDVCERVAAVVVGLALLRGCRVVDAAGAVFALLHREDGGVLLLYGGHVGLCCVSVGWAAGGSGFNSRKCPTVTEILQRSMGQMEKSKQIRRRADGQMALPIPIYFDINYKPHSSTSSTISQKGVWGCSRSLEVSG